MADIIQLLPDNVANQIAAGEVIQRPASVVKELMENAIDAGSTQIDLVIKDAGKTLIQVTDNGGGMTYTDARMCFERHATSKIKSADQLFQLTTKGFRGEALASIASIAHVDLKTKMPDEDLGTQLHIEGSNVTEHEPCACPDGTSIQVKNLFFNVPARRNFLKSDQVETKHIVEEFLRVAMPHNDITFSMHHNGDEVYFLPAGNRKQRLISIFGKQYDERLVPVDEETTIVKLSGYVGKPDKAKKTRGEQYFFVNNRFIKSPYLNHAINNAYSELISKDHFPSYFLFMEVDPQSIDVNIHPTKTEVKFEEEKSIYAILQSAVRNSLGKFNVMPTLDFNQEATFSEFIDPNRPVVEPEIKIDTTYNPFEKEKQAKLNNGGSSIRHAERSTFPSNPSTNIQNWESLYEVTRSSGVNSEQTVETDLNQSEQRKMFQISDKYIFTSIKSGYVVIDQYRAHYRILYDAFIQQIEHRNGESQGLIFPETVELSKTDFKLLNAIEDELKILGFAYQKEDYTINITAKPSSLDEVPSADIIAQLLDNFKMNADNNNVSPKETIARSLASGTAIRKGKKLNPQEISDLVDRLFACEDSQYAPNGKKIIINFTFEDIEKQFN